MQKEKLLGCLAVVEKVNNYMEVARIENQSIGSRQFIQFSIAYILLFNLPLCFSSYCFIFPFFLGLKKMKMIVKKER